MAIFRASIISGRLLTSTAAFMPEATEDIDDKMCSNVEDPAFCFLAGIVIYVIKPNHPKLSDFT